MEKIMECGICGTQWKLTRTHKGRHTQIEFEGYCGCGVKFQRVIQ